MATTYPEWRRLEEMLAVIKGQGIERLNAGEILEFGRLYRRAAAELSFHRTHEADPALLTYLNDLVGQCYPYVYTAPRRPWPSVWQFFLADFPRAFRRHALLILIAFLCSMIPAGIGAGIAWRDEAVADQLLPQQLLEAAKSVAVRHHTAQDWLPLEERPQASSAIMTNNIQVAIMAFAGGMTAGVLTIISMVYNGLMLGIVGAVVGKDGFATALNFWGFVAPHGVIELTAIFIAGGAGLVLAYAIVNPGELPRQRALRDAGKEALKLMLGVAAMLVVAGIIEGFFSPMNIPEEIKLTVATIEGLLLLSYLLLAGRKREEVEDATPFGTLMTPVPPV